MFKQIVIVMVALTVFIQASGARYVDPEWPIPEDGVDPLDKYGMNCEEDGNDVLCTMKSTDPEPSLTDSGPFFFADSGAGVRRSGGVTRFG